MTYCNSNRRPLPSHISASAARPSLHCFFFSEFIDWVRLSVSASGISIRSAKVQPLLTGKSLKQSFPVFGISAAPGAGTDDAWEPQRVSALKSLLKSLENGFKRFNDSHFQGTVPGHGVWLNACSLHLLSWKDNFIWPMGALLIFWHTKPFWSPNFVV